jgi:hypothetical protein
MTAEAHSRSLIVWDVPSAVECGESFGIRLGLKCREACRPEDWLIEVFGPEGSGRASAAVGGEPWPGTEALYVATIELEAPENPGLHAFEAVARATGGGEAPTHAAAGASFKLRTVPAADCRLRVVAIDRESQSPVPGVKVVVHPYRAVTDEQGIAELSVPTGPFRLFVSGKNFIPFRRDGELEADMTIRAELDVDLGPSDAELWP